MVQCSKGKRWGCSASGDPLHRLAVWDVVNERSEKDTEELRMYCVQCGKEIENSSRFCPYCGNSVIPMDGSTVGEDLSGVAAGMPGAVAELHAADIGVEADMYDAGMSAAGDNRFVKEAVVSAGKRNEKPKKWMIPAGVAACIAIIGAAAFLGLRLMQKPGAVTKQQTAGRQEQKAEPEKSAEKKEAAEKKETAETEKKQYTDKNTLDSNVEKKHLESQNQNQGQNQNQNQNQGASASISNGDYILPEIASRYYTETELSGMDAHTLSLARNELYARHGYIFKNTELQEYFGAKQWYTPQVAEVPDSSFNQYEKANLELIQNLEARY